MPTWHEMSFEKTCEVCGARYVGFALNQKYCTRDCRKAFKNSQRPPVVRELARCAVCSHEFLPRNTTQKICSEACREAHYKREKRLVQEGCTAAVGAWGECLISADLIRKGFEVFRNLAPAGKRDLIACKGKMIISIQVRPGYLRIDGSVGYPRRESEAGLIDHYAVYLPGDGTIAYDPPLPGDAEPAPFKVSMKVHLS